jgi:hypothetical protein
VVKLVDVLGRTRATLTEPASTSPWPKGLGNLVKLCRAGDRALQLLLFNEECLVSASHQLALITSLKRLYKDGDHFQSSTFLLRLSYILLLCGVNPEPPLGLVQRLIEDGRSRYVTVKI